uniref:NADH-ubiquinone oxidoreductase chain 6 n=1 Tax=Derodontidae sp. BMNH 899913 TaxID=1903806 RepID=A0A343A4G7_9COLE|nr:NADH dehydrogenase subunit 6 [Derodontidae sp. BMNH 899913]
MILYMLTINSILILFTSHPLSAGIILLIQTILVSLMIGIMSTNFWYSYIFLLILVGGMMILFMYMTSIASNEKFKLNIKILLTFPLMLFFSWNLNMFINNNTMMYNCNKIINLNMNKIINFPMNQILMIMVLYLLITLIATVKMMKMKKSAIRQMK